MDYIQSVLSTLSKFVNLPANKQLIYVMASIIIIATWLTVYFYKQNEKAHLAIRRELDKSELIIQTLVKERDSLYGIIYHIKLENLTRELDRSDSLLRESRQIKNSLTPIINKINKKIENNK